MQIVVGAKKQAVYLKDTPFRALARSVFLDRERLEPAIVRTLVMVEVVVPRGKREVARPAREPASLVRQVIQIAIKLVSALVLPDQLHGRLTTVHSKPCMSKM